MTTYAELQAQLKTARRSGVKPIARNGCLVACDDGAVAVRLHQTNILKFYPDGKVVYNTNGWRSSTTKKWLNKYGPLRIWQEKFEWYYGDFDAPREYHDGLTVLQ